jgi:hypothetical protein
MTPEENQVIEIGLSFSASMQGTPHQKQEKKICWLCGMNELHNFP